MRSPASFAGLVVAVFCLGLLAACNAGGRPANAPPIVEPAATGPAANPADFGKVIGGDYIVAPGDTLAAVSDRTNTPLRALIDMNNLQPPYGLAPGMHLAIKERSQYVVQRDDTLTELAGRYGVTESALVSINNLKPPYTLTPGQRIMIPSPTEASSQSGMTAEAVPPATPIGSINAAPLPSTSAPAPAPTVPGMTTPTTTVSGSTSSTTTTIGSGSIGTQSLPATTATPLPPATQPSATVSTAPVSSGTQVAALPAPPPAAPTVITPTLQAPAAQVTTQTPPKAAAMPATPTAPVAGAPTSAAAAVEKPAAGLTPDQADAATEAATASTDAAMESGPVAGSGKGPFVWPVQGKVIGAFGSSKDGLKNDGINIAAPAGAPVVAAADGTVAYAGNELRGFGNMILIRHDGGYVTAYAHNDSLLVKKGDKVKRGQTIARVGQTGAVFGPQLHFEIRKGTEPVDPMSYLGS